MLVFWEGFCIEICFSQTRQCYFSEISIADTDFYFREYGANEGSHSDCLLESIKACQLICEEQGKPVLFLPQWVTVESGEF